MSIDGRIAASGGSYDALSVEEDHLITYLSDVADAYSVIYERRSACIRWVIVSTWLFEGG